MKGGPTENKRHHIKRKRRRANNTAARLAKLAKKEYNAK